MPPPALILFAHGARDPRWAAPFEAVAERVRQARPDTSVRLAFLELMSPSLDAAIDALAAQGCRSIDVLPLFLGTGGHLRRDLAALIESARSRHPGLALTAHAAAGEQARLIDAMAELAASILPRP